MNFIKGGLELDLLFYCNQLIIDLSKSKIHNLTD